MNPSISAERLSPKNSLGNLRESVGSILDAERIVAPELVTYDSLRSIHKIYLLAGLERQRALSTQKRDYPTSNAPATSLTPTKAMNDAVYKSLFEHNVVKVHPASSVSAAELLETESFSNIRWTINVANESGEPFEKHLLLQRLLFDLQDQFDPADEIEITNMMSQLAVAELVQYLENRLGFSNISTSTIEPFLQLFSDLLQRYSVSEVMAFIYSQVLNSQKCLYTGKARDDAHAVDLVRYNLIPYLNRKYSYPHLPQSFGRDIYSGRSWLSATFYNSILGVDDLGFNECLHMAWEQAVASKFLRCYESTRYD